MGLVSFSVTIKISGNSTSPTSTLKSTVLFGISICPFASIIWKLGVGPYLTSDCGTSNWIFSRSASGIALDRAHVSKRSSEWYCAKIHRKIEHSYFVFEPKIGGQQNIFRFASSRDKGVHKPSCNCCSRRELSSVMVKFSP